MHPMFNALLTIVKAHTVWRVKAAFQIATFPLVTPRADDPILWKTCLRLAWRGLTSKDPRVMSWMLNMKEAVVSARRNADDLAQRPPGREFAEAMDNARQSGTEVN
jgi:hypothetical protein